MFCIISGPMSYILPSHHLCLHVHCLYIIYAAPCDITTIHHTSPCQKRRLCQKRSLSVRHHPQYCCQHQHPHQQQQLHHHHQHQLQKSIVKLITLTTLLPDSPLGLIWKHAFREGSKEGFKRGTELFKDKDVKQAFHEGVDQGQIMGILAEREEWKAEGHGQWCFDKPPTCLSCNIGFPDGHTCTTKLDAMVQVDFIKAWPPSVEAAIQVSPSHHTSSSQTKPPPLLVNAEAQAQLTDSAPAPATAPTLDPPAFNWSDNAASIPIIPIFPKNQPCCDLSALHTTNPNPFSSLAHQNHHSQLPLEDQPSFRPCWAPPHLPVSQSTSCQWFIPISAPIAPVPSTLSLNWESDPHLSDLSQALKVLGWIHQWLFLYFYSIHCFIFPHLLDFGYTLHFLFLVLFPFQQLGGGDTSIMEGGRWNRESVLQNMVTCTVDTHVTCTSYSLLYHHWTQPAIHWEASLSVPLFWQVVCSTACVSVSRCFACPSFWLPCYFFNSGMLQYETFTLLTTI